MKTTLTMLSLSQCKVKSRRRLPERARGRGNSNGSWVCGCVSQMDWHDINWANCPVPACSARTPQFWQHILMQPFTVQMTLAAHEFLVDRLQDRVALHICCIKAGMPGDLLVRSHVLVISPVSLATVSFHSSGQSPWVKRLQPTVVQVKLEHAWQPELYSRAEIASLPRS